MKKSKLLFAITLVFVLFAVFSLSISAKNAPTGIYVNNETISKKGDGEICNVSDGMEYRALPDGEWIGIFSDKVRGLSAGSYAVRYAATKTEEASPATTVNIKEGRKLLVNFYADGKLCYSYELSYGDTLSELPNVPKKEGSTTTAPTWDVTDFSDIKEDINVNAVYTANVYSVVLPVGREEYKVEAVYSSMFVEHGKSYTFRFVLEKGYTCTEKFKVKVNGKEVSLKADNTYTIASVERNTSITVEGVEDITAPSVELRASSFSWNTLSNGTAEFIYTNKNGSIKLISKDEGSGISDTYILLSDYQLSSEELNGVYYWESYSEGMTIPQGAPKFIYAKVVDKAGNISYVGSDGIVFDNVSPSFNVTEDETYYGKTKIEIDDAFLDTVTVDGKTASSSFTLFPRELDYVVSATDKAGNKTQMRLKVKKAVPNYTVPVDLVATVSQTLNDVELPIQAQGRFVWMQPLSTSVGNIGKNTFMATFMPNDTDNYQIVSNIPITVSVLNYVHEAPKEITARDESVSGIGDGAIFGLKEGMEYRASESNVWIPTGAGDLENLAAGIYYVRYAATDDYHASQYVEITIKEGRKLIVTFVIDGETVATEEVSYGATIINVPSIPNKIGYNHVTPYWDISEFTMIKSDMTVNAVYTPNTYEISFPQSDKFNIRAQGDAGIVRHGENYRFFVDMADGYMPSIYFEIKSNGTLLQPEDDGSYVIESASEAYAITISGIVSSARLEDIKIDGIYNKTYYAIGDKFSFSTVGIGLDNKHPVLGDERYTPISWSAYYDESWTAAPYSASFTLYKEGDCTISIRFKREVFDGTEWHVYGENPEITHKIYVNKLPAGLPSGNSALSTIISIVLISTFTGVFVMWYLSKKKKSK